MKMKNNFEDNSYFLNFQIIFGRAKRFRSKSAKTKQNSKIQMMIDTIQNVAIDMTISELMQ